ncbi:MAG: EAL domain-containing protein [Geminicoccaceae bacterium]|nr:EAL domain-containing protein [Geminicoccaceae bacterium]
MATDPERTSEERTGGGLGEEGTPFRAAGSVVPLEGLRRAGAFPAPVAVSGASSGSCRVLVVSADEELYEIVRDLLDRAERPSFRVDGATSADAALRRLAASRFDVVLVDEHLPERDGLELVRVFQRRGIRVPIVLLSEDVDRVDPAAAIDLGIGDLLEKEELEVGRLVRSLRFAIARRKLTDRLDHLAQYDELTGLANRSLFKDRLEHAVGAARRHRASLAVMILDLDGFKAVNDTFGHAAGDRVLGIVAERLRGCVRETDTVARLGGDEFAILIENLARPERATTVARKLLDALEPPIRFENKEVRIGGSLGVALYPNDGQDPHTLMRLADAAMYAVKAQGGRSCRFHDPTLDQRMRRGSILEADLRRAFERGEFVLFFQPQVPLCPGELGIAAILRWQHPELGIVEADRFRAVAEEGGLIDPITEWLIDEACRCLREWHDAGWRCCHLCVPVLPRRQLAWSDLGARVGARLAHGGLPRTALELEVEERAIFEDLETGGAGLTPLAQEGLRLAIDRFGAHIGSLRLLRDVPLRTLKIARELLRDVPEDLNAGFFLRSVVGMAREAGVRVVAEGVETRAQLEFLRHIGCHAVQAATSCPPLPLEACSAWLRERSEAEETRPD